MLADRVVVLSPRPARVRGTLTSTCRGRAAARIPRSSSCAAARWSCSPHERPRRHVSVWLLPPRSCSRCCSAGSSTPAAAPSTTSSCRRRARSLRSLSDDRDLLWDNFWVTAAEVGLGILVALCLGALLAIAIHLVPVLRRALYPLLVGSQAVRS